jgi:hypothetical protein
MKTEDMHIGMRVKHPQYGVGLVKTLTEHTADIRFDDGQTRTVAPEPSDLRPAEAQVAVTGLSRPLQQFVEETVRAVADHLGLANPGDTVAGLGARWHKGRLVLHPADPTLQTKEVPLEGFFHKIVMMRNNLRVLEQKINGHERLSDAEKIELQQYVTRCYGSMTTFNALFRNKEDQFAGSSGS